MSEELLGVDIFSGSWWSSMRCGGIDVLPPWAPAATEMVDGNACRPFDDSPASCITFLDQHNAHNPQPSVDQITSTPLMDSVLSHPSVDWFQSIIDESCGSSVHAMFQEVSTSKPHHVQGYCEPWHDPLKNISHGFLIDPRLPESTVRSDISSFGFQQESPAGGEPLRPSSLRTCPLQFVRTSIEEKPGLRNPQAVKYCDSEAARNSSYYSSVLKKARIEAQSPLPPFKVRKEKLGDRITALQQLVSPFGKTDTGSVLYEAIEYIKFLHEQVRAQSSPYLRNGSKMNHQQDSERMAGGESPNHDLRSQGLCLVPISTTFAVTSGGFWTPTFGGNYI